MATPNVVLNVSLLGIRGEQEVSRRREGRARLEARARWEHGYVPTLIIWADVDAPTAGGIAGLVGNPGGA